MAGDLRWDCGSLYPIYIVLQAHAGSSRRPYIGHEGSPEDTSRRLSNDSATFAVQTMGFSGVEQLLPEPRGVWQKLKRKWLK